MLWFGVQRFGLTAIQHGFECLLVCFDVHPKFCNLVLLILVLGYCLDLEVSSPSATDFQNM